MAGSRFAAETKWSTGTKLDALDETPWDAIKLVHARSTLQGVRWALLITAAPIAAWNVARFSHIFDESLISTSELLSLNPHMFSQDAKSRPLKLPPYVQSSPTVRVGFRLGGKEWEVRVASLRANGEPWNDCDDQGFPLVGEERQVMDWPHPEPGLGMEHDDGESIVLGAGPLPPLATEELQPADVPGPQATWSEIMRFAYRHDGYAKHGDSLASLANESVRRYASEHAIDQGLEVDDLRSCLFFEARRYHHLGHAPAHDSVAYIRALLAAMSQSAAEWGRFQPTKIAQPSNSRP